MKFRGIIFLLLVACSGAMAQSHPIAFGTGNDFAQVKASLTQPGFLASSYADIKKQVDAQLGKDIDVPVPKDPAGGYTHEQHKSNYFLMFNAGQLYLLTKDSRYALLVKNLFLKYAALNPTLKKHPEATSNSAGHLFWQSLNDANWLVYTGLAFDCIYNYLSPAERKTIAEGAFKPEVDYFTRDLKSWFDLIHNHAVWACAGVGIVGIATDNDEYLQKALYGSDKNGKAGFLAQIDGLFSPDGYYNEGPYYTRYAILPFYLFAQAINNHQPQKKIFQYRNQVLKKALDGALQQTNLNGGFFSYNDALKEKTYNSSELVYAIDIAWQVYGADKAYLPVAKAQGRVVLCPGGVGISSALKNSKNIPAYYPYRSMEFTDGAKGDKGGVSILRSGKDEDLTSLIFKYSSHGMAHGHFDKLNINLYDNGHEIIQDYGAARFIGIEQKWGGRYLPETKTYTQQTIAHNTVTVDETSHYNGNEALSEEHHPVRIFGNIHEPKVQVIAAKDDQAYKGVAMQRSLYMITLPDERKPILLDIFQLKAGNEHQYDLPFNYCGTLIQTNFKYQAAQDKMNVLGKKNGYQFLWKEAEAMVKLPFSQFTFLQDKQFYTISTICDDSTQVFFTRIGANDPNFNLRRESAYILRKNGTNRSFISVLEIHGNYSTEAETASNSYSRLTGLKTITDNEEYTLVQVTVNGKQLVVAQANKQVAPDAAHQLKWNGTDLNWTGPYILLVDGKKYN